MCLLSWWECVFLRIVWSQRNLCHYRFFLSNPCLQHSERNLHRYHVRGTIWKWHVVQGHFTSRTTEKYVHVGLMRQGHKFWHLGRCRMVQDVAGINIYMYIYIYLWICWNELVKGKWRQLVFSTFSLGYVHLPSVSFIFHDLPISSQGLVPLISDELIRIDTLTFIPLFLSGHLA
jgi:hypothetical protein